MIHSLLIFLVFSLLFFSCNLEKIQSENITEESSYEERMNFYLNAVCSPFGGEQIIPGVRAKLYQGALGSKKFSDFIQEGSLISDKVFLSSLDRAPGSFTKGFENNSGDLLKDAQDEPLLEWFALDMETNIQLNDDQEEGYYIFKGIIDDGFWLEFEGRNQEMETVVKYEAWTPPRHHCFTTKNGNIVKAYRMTRNTVKSARARYFQGPRYLISLQLKMKKIANLDDYTGSSVELSMESEQCSNSDFEILNPDNYYVLGDFNPCEEPNP